MKIVWAYLVKALSVIAALMMISSVILGFPNTNTGMTGGEKGSGNGVVSLGSRVDIPCAQHINVSGNFKDYLGNLQVLVTFALSNQTRLSAYLKGLSTPSSPLYHSYMTRSEFAANFSISASSYERDLNFFESFSGVQIRTYSDRISIKIQGNANAIESIFGTKIVKSGINSVYFPNAPPNLPSSIAGQVSQISGLTDAGVAMMSPLSMTCKLPSNITTQTGYPKPITTSNGQQYVFGSELQVAYSEQSLFNITFPTGEVIATILWAGNSSTGQHVAPFDPTDVYNYYNSTLPSGEPHSKIYGVPLDHAVPPGPSADEDTTGAYIENTLDLEMVGSMAPGSSIFNVYGPQPTEACLNSALAFILNPSQKYSSLNNVSVVSNSWGTPEFNDTTWYEYLQEAQARGISILASSGDSGNNPSSSEYQTNPNYSNDFLNFPASMAYNYFGITSVGGTSLFLNSNLQIKSQVAWYETIEESILGLFKIGTPVGSVGGISQVFPETQWQRNTEANSVIGGKGLGVPDIGAIANNTAMCISTNGQRILSGVAGTSIASPVEAGIVSEIDAVLRMYGKPSLGYLNPMIYSIANRQMFGPTGSISFLNKNNFDSALPLYPFFNVHKGANDEYGAERGYNLVTGWGSINAYNLTVFLLNSTFAYDPNSVSSIQEIVNISSAFANSTLSGKTERGFSVDQIFYLADALGSLLYKIISFENFTQLQNGSYIMSYGLISCFPYTSSSIKFQAYNKSAGSDIMNSIDKFTYKVGDSLINNRNVMGSILLFELAGHKISLNVPGSSYIVGGGNYSYEPNTFSDSGIPKRIVEQSGVLDPQSTLTSLYPNGDVTFSKNTEICMQTYQMQTGKNSYQSTESLPFTGSSKRIPANAYNISFSETKGKWNITYSTGSIDQGFYSFIPSYGRIFKETGLGNGQFWKIKLDNLTEIATGTEFSLNLSNGTYTGIISGSSDFTAIPDNYTFTVCGKTNSVISVEFESLYNQTLLKQISKINPVANITTSAEKIRLNSNKIVNEKRVSSSLVVDPLLNRMFYLDTNLSKIYALNSVSGSVITVLNFNQKVGLETLIFQNSSDMLYAYSENTGNLSEINPNNLKIEENVSLSGFPGVYATIEGGTGNFQVIAFSPQTGYFGVDFVNRSVSKIVSNTGNYNDYSYYFYAKNGNVYSVNESSNELVILNVSLKIQTTISLPSGFDPQSVFYSGYGQILYLSGKYGNSYALLSYNYSNGDVGTPVKVNSLGIASSYDKLNGLTYIQTAGNQTMIYIVNPSNLTIFGSAPYLLNGDTNVPLQGIIFNSEIQDIFTASNNGEIYKYRVQQFFRITFEEQGLPHYIKWRYDIIGVGKSKFIGTNSTNLEIHNGTFALEGNSNVAAFILYPYQISFTVNGKNMTTMLNFTYSYPVTFSENGLPSYISWYVNITNIKPSGIIFANSYTAMVPNGTHIYHLASSNKIFSPVNHTSYLEVNGAQRTISVRFYLVTFTVNIEETGLYNNTKWSLENNTGYQYFSDNSNLPILLPNGTYIINITTLQDYYTLHSSIEFTVNGKNITEKIEFFHYAYVIGNVIPKNSVIEINGFRYNSTNGLLNVSLKAGYYTLKITAPGYNYYYSDFSLRPGQVENIGNITLTKVPHLTQIFYDLFYGSLIGIIIAMITVGIYFARKKRE